MTSRTITFGILFTFLAVAAIFPIGCSQPSPSPTAPTATDTVTITQPTPSPTQEETPAATPATPGKTGELTPYSLTKGRRDPFVPFGGVMPESQTQAAPVKTETPKPAQQGAPKQPVQQKAAAPVVETVPVVVTGTFISGGKNFAIVQGEGGGPSFMVTTGDKVGEYYVKSVTAQRVVLTWSGKDYLVKMKAMDSPFKGGGSAPQTKGGEQQKQSLSPPQTQTQGGPGGGQPQQMGPPPGGGGSQGAPGGSPGGAPGGAPGGGTPQKSDGSKPN